MLKEWKGYKIFVVILLAALGFGILFNYNFKIILIDGDSMSPTLHNKNMIIIKNREYSLNYRDIIVFEKEGTNIKRIVAIPGDVVLLHDGQVAVNGIPIKPYTYEGKDCEYSLDEGEYFVIGDNYLDSYDSRDYGPIDRSDVIGLMVIPRQK